MLNKPVEEHFQRLMRLLDLEAEAEKQAILDDLQRLSPGSAEAAGTALVNLVIRDESAGMGGRILLTLAKRNQSLPLPWTRLNSGSPVILSEENQVGGSSIGWRGVVTRLYKENIQVAFSDWPETEADHPTFRLDRSSDEFSRQRQRQALQKAQAAGNSRLGELRDVLLGRRLALFHPAHQPLPLDKNLNNSQLEAVGFALSAADIAIIHGPPGTGKTTTVVELIRQIVRNGQRVLAVAPSNIAVDNLLEKLLAKDEKAIRLGHPARVLPELRQHTLDLLVENHPDMKVVQRLAREARALRAQASRYTRARPEPGARRALREEAKQALSDSRRIEEQVIERLLNASQIICATLTGLDRDLLGSQHFDWCIVDEASQSTEAAAWAPLQIADRVVLAGDHFQLPPTVISSEALAQGFDISLLERLMAQTGKDISRRLTVQYRMHHEIMDFSSQEFYEGSLTAHSSVENHRLSDLPGVTSNDLTDTPIHFIDTAGASYDESQEPDGDSRFNISEALLVVKKVQDLLDSGLAPANIAVISPYSAQVRLLRARITQPEIEIDSVDGFQGREKEAVIVSLVRSNRENQIGFLEDVRRMNVALTRARRKLIVIGDSATITAHPFYHRMVTYFESVGGYHSVWEEIQ
ncbi:MAG: AAA domain-containing protein [Chloroflexi bacterium]|nr:AAA domain-containing protein [Chloroflexota bacterium]